MSELKAALERLAARADDAAMPSPSAIRASGARRTRRAAVTVAGVGVAAVVAVVVALSRLPDPAQDDSLPAVDQSQTPTSSPSGVVSSSEWETLRPDWGARYMQPNAVAAQGSTFVAVADTSYGPRGTTPIWWSDDGRTWTRASGAESSNVTDLIVTDVGFLATGIDRDGAAAFWSEDGTTWVKTMDAPRRGEVDALWGIAETDLGYFAWGFVGTAPALYRSSDGRTWTVTDLRAPAGRAEDTRVCSVADSARGGVTATGGVRDGRSGPENLAIWASEDGSTWDRAEVTDGDAITTCNQLGEAHWSAAADAGTVRIEPFGEDGLLYFRPAD